VTVLVLLRLPQVLDEGVFYRKYVTSTYSRMKKVLDENEDVRSQLPASIR